MASFKWDQLNFTRGELDPRVQARTDWPNYYKAAKQIRNCVCIPQGGVTRRWGTRFIITCDTAAKDHPSVKLFPLPYNDEATYLLLWEGLSYKVILEGIIIWARVTTYNKEDIINLRFTQVENRVVITDGNNKPKILKRSDSDAIIQINPVPNSEFFKINFEQEAYQYQVNTILPIRVTLVPAQYITSPQIFVNRIYFIKIINFEAGRLARVNIFNSIDDAVNSVNKFTVGNIPAALVTQGRILNKWTIQDMSFVTLPAYDFNADYLSSAVNFTVDNATGTPDRMVNITKTTTTTNNAGATVVTPTAFSPACVGGIFNGNGGVVRIRKISANNMTISGITIHAFPINTFADKIPGDLAFLAEPAWSDTKGWPKVSSYFQNRMVFANTVSIPNGQWLSVINSVYDFDDSVTDADSAISSYPSSGGGGFIRSITSTRSLLVHTNKGNYSTPVQSEVAIMPGNFMLSEHNKFGVGELLPAYIDNQLFFVDASGNNVITMTWDFIQGNYVTNSVSISASTLVKNPIDMTSFSEPQYLDGFYVLFINVDGTLCVLQTLKEEDILAFSLSDTKTSLVSGQNGETEELNGYYRKVVAAQNRCWFLTERQLLQQRVASITINGISLPDASFITSQHGLILNKVYRIVFSKMAAIGAVLPSMTPIISDEQFFFAVPISANKLCIYGSLIDAKNNVEVNNNNPNNNNTINRYVPNTTGTFYSIKIYDVISKLMIEEVDFDYYTDMSTTVNSANAITTVPVNPLFNGIVMQVVADGNVLQNRIVFNSSINIERASNQIKVGTQYISKLVPLSPVVPENPGMLFNPTHIRTVYVSFYNTVGATIQGYGIPTQTINQVQLGALPDINYGIGVFCYAPMEGWSGLISPDLEITQEKPLPMTITGLSYVIDS